MRRAVLLAVSPVLLVVAMAGPALACPSPDSPVAGRVRAWVAKHEGSYTTQAQREYAAAERRMDKLVYGAVARTIGLQARRGDSPQPLAAGPRWCSEDTQEDGTRKMAYCLKIYGYGLNAFGAVDLHAYGWRPGVGWVTMGQASGTSPFDSMTVNYTKLWHDNTSLPGPEPLFSFGQSAAEWGCTTQVGTHLGDHGGCSVPNSSVVTLYSTWFDQDSTCTAEVWSTGNYTDLSWRSDRHVSHFVPRFTQRSPWSGF